MHNPQLPPQPSGPHVFPVQFRTQVFEHTPFTHDSPLAQTPQLPPQPSSPQFLPTQFGTQVLEQLKFTHD